MGLRRGAWFSLVLGSVSALLTLLVIEAAGRVFLAIWPSYDVLFLEPEPTVGWTQVPNLDWTWAGVDWYAKDYSVRIRTNSLGFRDLERSPAKPEGTMRVALLGDSFVEAIQVPLEKTAGQLLEAHLNTTGKPNRYEVLNFGISNYGVGQYLLTWERFANAFDPDYVVVLVGGYQLQRTVSGYEIGRFHHSSQRGLWIRPTFRLQDGRLVREPAADYQAFVTAQSELIAGEFAGSRSRRRETSVLGHLAKALWSRNAAAGKALAPPSAPGPGVRASDAATLLAVNLRILEELAQQIENRGGRMVLADGGGYFDTPSGASEALKRLCSEHAIGYVPLGERLREANQSGRGTRWPHDGHFNEAGNQVFAESLSEWMAQHAGR
jgi:lysophospholipase L1-like esterase